MNAIGGKPDKPDCRALFVGQLEKAQLCGQAGFVSGQLCPCHYQRSFTANDPHQCAKCYGVEGVTV